MRQQLQDAQVTIVGLGLMGGSLAAALQAAGACRRVVGVARRQETADQALTAGLVDDATLDLEEGVRQAEIVVLALPVRAILTIIGEIGPMLPDGCLLTDVGSTKQAVVQAMRSLPPHVQPLGGHPMCGKEVSGLAAADGELFAGACYILTPQPRTSDASLGLGLDVVRAVGANPLVLDAPRHDRLAAVASHLPYMAAIGLTMAAEDLEDDTIWKVAASGFRDTSRLAASDVTMMVDILLTNAVEVSKAVTRYQTQLLNLAQILEKGDEESLRALFDTAAQRRRSLFQ